MRALNVDIRDPLYLHPCNRVLVIVLVDLLKPRSLVESDERVRHDRLYGGRLLPRDGQVCLSQADCWGDANDLYEALADVIDVGDDLTTLTMATTTTR